MPRVPPVSIVIPALNEERYLPGLLESLANVREPMGVIVVDGNSSDKTIEVARSFESRFSAPSSLLVISSERGISRQRNAGAAVAKNEILAFLDADIIIPSREQYVALISTFAKYNYSVAMPHIIAREPMWQARLIYSAYDIWVRFFMFFGKPHFAGACLLTTKTVFNAIGGFDTTLSVAEDVNYSVRAAKMKFAGILPVRIPVSARRLIRDGYRKMFWTYLREGFIFAVTGKGFKKIPYPFGEC